MRTFTLLSVLVLAFLCVGVTARRHHSKHDEESPATVVAVEPIESAQSEENYLFEASVVNQGFNTTEDGLLKGPANGWTLFKQCDGQWGSNTVGTSSKTICQIGCAMSSVAMALNTRGANVNPGSLNSWLKSHGGYVSSNLLVWTAVNAFEKIAYYNYYRGAGSMSQADLQNVIGRGWAVIANVRNGGHWVLVTGHQSGSTYSVNDPGFSVSSYEYSNMVNFVVYSNK